MVGDEHVLIWEIVIGSGPAAHTAAIYLARAELKRESMRHDGRGTY